MEEVKGLGAVSIDGREIDILTLSDENVVKYLILYRSKTDVSYNAIVNIDMGQAGDIFDFNQELVALYASLDKTIKQCNFKEKQMKLLELVFEGNILHDICKIDSSFKRSATYDLFNRMVVKIVKVNNDNWKNSMKVQGLIRDKEEKDSQ